MGLLAELYTVICISRLERVQLAVAQGTTTCRRQAATIQLLYTVVVGSWDEHLCLFPDNEQCTLLGGSDKRAACDTQHEPPKHATP
jgi:hypothetical protein